jgi:hypothetical protein
MPFDGIPPEDHGTVQPESDLSPIQTLLLMIFSILLASGAVSIIWGAAYALLPLREALR